MKITTKGKDFENAPDGMYDAVCVDVVDLGMKKTQHGEKPKIRLVWEVSEKMDDGRPFLVMQQYNATLGVNNAGVPSALRKDLKSWRGQDFTEAELAGPDGQGLDIETLLGKPCQLLVQNEEYNGKTYANIKAITKAKVKLAPSGKYIRVQDRPKGQTAPSGNAQPQGRTDEPVEEIPF